MTTDPVEWVEPEVIDLQVVVVKPPAGKAKQAENARNTMDKWGFPCRTMDLTVLKFANQGTVAAH